MPTPSIVPYYSGLVLRTTRCDRLFRVAVSKYCVLTLMVFLLSALVGAPLGLRKEFPGLVDLVAEGFLFPTSFRVRECLDAVRSFQIICHCSFEESFAFLTY